LDLFLFSEIIGEEARVPHSNKRQQGRRCTCKTVFTAGAPVAVFFPFVEILKFSESSWRIEMLGEEKINNYNNNNRQHHQIP
jgi:hypothetical protein